MFIQWVFFYIFISVAFFGENHTRFFFILLVLVFIHNDETHFMWTEHIDNISWEQISLTVHSNGNVTKKLVRFFFGEYMNGILTWVKRRVAVAAAAEFPFRVHRAQYMPNWKYLHTFTSIHAHALCMCLCVICIAPFKWFINKCSNYKIEYNCFWKIYIIGIRGSSSSSSHNNSSITTTIEFKYVWRTFINMQLFWNLNKSKTSTMRNTYRVMRVIASENVRVCVWVSGRI